MQAARALRKLVVDFKAEISSANIMKAERWFNQSDSQRLRYVTIRGHDFEVSRVSLM